MIREQNLVLEKSSDPDAVPKRVALVHRQDSLRVATETEEVVMTVPHLVLREAIAFQLLVCVLTIYSLLVDAPLEQLANPLKTPNPAKAPWYFLGLQELLHYFPPLVAGVLVPGLVVVALVVIPYFRINVRRERLWDRRHRSVFATFAAAVAVTLVFLTVLGVWPVVVPSFVTVTFMTASYVLARDEGCWGWICQLSLPAWIMIWFVTCATTLTVIGTWFRGPGWSWVWPCQ